MNPLFYTKLIHFFFYIIFSYCEKGRIFSFWNWFYKMDIAAKYESIWGFRNYSILICWFVIFCSFYALRLLDCVFFSHFYQEEKQCAAFSGIWISQCWKSSFDSANCLLFNDTDKIYMDHQLIYHHLEGKAWRLGRDSALGFGLRLPSGAGDEFQQVFISAYKLNYKALETKWGGWANAAALENCVSGSDKIEGLTWQTEFSVQWKWLSRMGQKVIHSIESNHRSMIISCLSTGKWKVTGVSFVVSALPDCLLVGHCAEPGLEGVPSLPVGVQWP